MRSLPVLYPQRDAVALLALHAARFFLVLAQSIAPWLKRP